jgi:hypothetical protein
MAPPSIGFSPRGTGCQQLLPWRHGDAGMHDSPDRRWGSWQADGHAI